MDFPSRNHLATFFYCPKSLASLDAVIENETPYEINDDALGKAPTDETDVDDNTDANDDEE